jgi:cell division protein FtsZ
LSEVEILMRDLNKHIGEETQLLFGTAVDGRMGDRLSVTLLSSLPVAETEIAPRKPKRTVTATAPPPEPVVEPPTIESFVESETANIQATIEPEPAQPVFQEPEILDPEPVIEENLPPRETPEATPLAEAHVEEQPPPSPPRIIPPKKKPLIAPKAEPENPKRDKAAPARQEVLQFEPVTRGRFEKSEPTIVEGQDLDVPTFLRKNIRVK